jgi:CrcB protein
MRRGDPGVAWVTVSVPSVLVIAAAGAVGTVLRHATGVGLVGLLGAPQPVATVAVNLLGSGALGFVAEALSGQTLAGADARLVLGVGLLGGFTTYSSFNLELLRMVQDGALGRALGYVLGTVIGCLLAGALGIALARMLPGGVQPP